MALDDIRVDRPRGRAERMSRTADYKKFSERFDAIFRKGKKRKADTRRRTKK